MEPILILNTGGTFNKRYNPLRGELEVPKDSNAIESILHHCSNTHYTLRSILHKDSLEMNDADRAHIAHTIQTSTSHKILIVHGTDTMDQTARFLALHVKEKCVILTGAMVPFSIDTTEATANFMFALGALHVTEKKGIYIAMHGAIAEHSHLYKTEKKAFSSAVKLVMPPSYAVKNDSSQ